MALTPLPNWHDSEPLATGYKADAGDLRILDGTPIFSKNYIRSNPHGLMCSFISIFSGWI